MLVQPQNNVAAKIKVVGVGGGGCNAINTMISDFQIDGVEFIAVNTDIQVLNNSLAPTKIQIGAELTSGLGAGGNPEVGRQAAEESAEELHAALEGADMVFVTGGMGGGTGTGAIPVISGIAKNAGALVVSIVTKPFAFEMKKRMEIALEGISKLKESTDTMIVIPNQRLLEIIDKNLSFKESLKKVDEVLANAVQSISSLVTNTDFINLDFADVRVALKDAGTAMMGIGKATGENRATQAARQAMTSPLLEMSIQGAKSLLFTIRGGTNLTMHEVDQAASLITELVDPSAVIKFGASIDENLGDELQITVLAAGFPDENMMKPNYVSSNQQTSQEPQNGPLNMQIPKSSNSSRIEDSGDPLNNSQEEDELEIPAFLRKNS